MAKPSGDAGNSGNARLCQKGGWQTLVRADGTSFANQTECVQYGAQGGTPQTPVVTVTPIVTETVVVTPNVTETVVVTEEPELTMTPDITETAVLTPVVTETVVVTLPPVVTETIVVTPIVTPS